MQRNAMDDLIRWKRGGAGKPLVVRGARLVGKTWLLREFGRTAFERTVYADLKNNRRIRDLFTDKPDAERIVTGLELFAGQRIDPENTLIILDEAQEAPAVPAALKNFSEKAPRYKIACACQAQCGAPGRESLFSADNVGLVNLYPLSFTEFMRAMGKDKLAETLLARDYALCEIFNSDFADLLRYYIYVGGMPEAAGAFCANRDFNEARAIQQNILAAYERDFSHSAPDEILPRVRMLWESVPSQLSKENKKFMYGVIKDGARAKEFAAALAWLDGRGFVNKVMRLSAPGVPADANTDVKAFKLFPADVGLLSCMLRLKQDTLLDGNKMFYDYEGALAEQFVYQQLKTLGGVGVYYWTNRRGNAEIEFVIISGTEAIPIEVNARVNLQAKSLKFYRDKYNPILSIRASMSAYKDEIWLVNIPLWAIETII